MAKTDFLTYRITDRRRQWIEELAERLGLDPDKRGDGAAVLDFALKSAVFGAAVQPPAPAPPGAAEEKEKNDHSHSETRKR